MCVLYVYRNAQVSNGYQSISLRVLFIFLHELLTHMIYIFGKTSFHNNLSIHIAINTLHIAHYLLPLFFPVFSYALYNICEEKRSCKAFWQRSLLALTQVAYSYACQTKFYKLVRLISQALVAASIFRCTLPHVLFNAVL